MKLLLFFGSLHVHLLAGEDVIRTKGTPLKSSHQVAVADGPRRLEVAVTEIHIQAADAKRRPGDLSHLVLLTAFDPRSQLYWWSTLGSVSGTSLEAERDRFLGSHKFAIGDSKLVSFMVVDRFLWVRSCNQRSPDQEGGYQQALIKFREMHTQLLTGTKRIDMFTALGGDFLNDTPAKMMDIEIESVAWVDNGWKLEVRARNNDRRGSIFLDPDFELAIGPVRP